MSVENNNYETPESKKLISRNEQDNITTNTNNDNKNNSNLNSPDRLSKNSKTSKKNLVSNLLSIERNSSTKTIIDDTKLANLDNETNKTTASKDFIRKREAKKTLRKKIRKKGKKGKKTEHSETESILLTEVKVLPKKKEEEKEKEKEKEETINQKYLRKQLKNLNFSKNLQNAINTGFEKIKDEIKDNLDENYNINENKKTNIEELIQKNNKKLNSTLDQKGVKYNIDKQSIMNLLNLKNDEKNIKIKLNKLEENQKLLNSELLLKNDVIGINTRKMKLKKMASMKTDLLSKLNYNSARIGELLDSNRTINRNILIKNYMSPENYKNAPRNNNNLLLDNYNKFFSLSDDQERYNRHLLQIQKEEKIQREKMQKDLKISNEKKCKEIELNENKKIQRQKNYLEELKNKEKAFFNKKKEKNNLILEKSIKYIGEKNHKKKKDYLFFQFKKKFENNEKKLIDKVNMMKKDSLVTKKELEELANKREEQKKILEEGLNERKLKLIKMWKERSKTLPVYKHPVVDMLEDEEYDLMEEKEDKKEQKEKNEKVKKNYQPPKVKIDMKLKQIRENRNIKTNKESVTQTEVNNKKKFLKNLNLMANILEAAKLENIEKNKTKINKNKEEKDIHKKLKISKSFAKNDNKIKHNYKLHPKPEKPIDYLKDLVKQKRNKYKFDIGVGDIIAELKERGKNKGRNQIIETLDMVKSKTNEIDRKVLEKKKILEINGGYLHNTKLGDEVGDLLIESIQSKISLLKKLNE